MDSGDEVYVSSKLTKSIGKIVGASFLSSVTLSNGAREEHRYTLPTSHAQKLALKWVGKDTCDIKGLMFKVTLPRGGRTNTAPSILTLVNKNEDTNNKCKSIW